MAETLRTYQVRGYVSRRGCGRLNKMLAECADLYNAELEIWRKQYEETGKSDSLFERMKAFTVKRNANSFWGSVSVEIGRGVLIRMEAARQAFYRRCRAGEKPGFPRFKSYHRYRTIQIEQPTPAMVQPERNGFVVRTKGLPVVRLRTSRALPPPVDLKSIRITFRGRRPSVNLTYVAVIKPLHPSSAKVGLDMGVMNRITTSDGKKIERHRPDRDDIARKQRRLSACEKGSIRFLQRRRVLANSLGRARVRNRNHCHQITTDLVRRHGFIALEKLNIPNMTRPGGKRKRGLNRAILEQTWGRIAQQLAYKAASAGRQLVFVNPRNTSQRCSSCGAMVKKGLEVKRHVCGCGLDLDRDHNAALNILQKALAGGAFPAAAGEAA